MKPAGIVLRLAAVVAAVLLGIAAPATAGAAGETPIRIPDQAVYDLAAAFDLHAERTAESLAGAIRANGDADVVVVTETVADGFTAEEALVRATALRIALKVGDDHDAGGLLAYFGVAPDGCTARVHLSADATFGRETLSTVAAAAIVTRDIDPLAATCDLDNALLVGMGRIATAALGAGVPVPGDGTIPSPIPGADAGPPFPDPVDGVAVTTTPESSGRPRSPGSRPRSTRSRSGRGPRSRSIARSSRTAARPRRPTVTRAP